MNRQIPAYQSRRSLSLSVLVVFLSIWLTVMLSCIGTETVQRRSALQDPIDTGPLTIMTKTKVMYTLNNYLLNDSSLTGSGFVEENDTEHPFKGEIMFRDIDYVQIRKENSGRSLLVGAALATIGILAVQSLQGDNPFVIKDFVATKTVGNSGGEGGSCPFVYSWNGSKYSLDGEAFATSWGKALERTTSIIVPKAKEKNGQYAIRITNERPETHYINSIAVIGVESDHTASVYCDPANRVWPVYQTESPLSAIDGIRNDILPTVSSMDGNYWESSDRRISSIPGYRDEIELIFQKPRTAKEGTLIIRSINSTLFNAVLQTMSDVMGNDLLHFVNAVENDPEMISILQQWLDESSLKVSQWNGSGWDEIGCVPPEANEVPFTRVIRFTVNGATGDSVRIKLSTLHDVWKFDAVQTDWTPVVPLRKKSITLNSAITDEGENVLRKISATDDHYVVVLPSHAVDCLFYPTEPAAGKKITYGIEVCGYIHEWFPPRDQRNESFPDIPVSSTARIQVFKNFLNNRSLVLPMIYARWEEMNEDRMSKQ